MLSPRWAGRPTVAWFIWLSQTLGVLGSVHSGLSGATQSQSNPSVAAYVQRAITESKRYELNGHPEEGLRELVRSERTARQAHDDASEALLLNELTICQAELFQYGPAAKSARSALALAERTSQPAVAGKSLVHLSTIYTQLGDIDSAEEFARRAVRTFEAAGDLSSLSQALLGLAVVEFQRREFSEGVKTCDRSIAVAHQLHASAFEAFAWDYKGILLLLSGGATPQAGDALNKAAALLQEQNDSDRLAVNLEHRAEFELAAGRPKGALQLMNQAFTQAGPSFKTHPQYYPLHVYGQIYSALGNQDAALEKFRRAVQAASEWRDHALPGDTTNTETVAQLQSVYSDFAQLAARLSLTRHDQQLAYTALGALMDNRAASLREQLQAAISDNLQNSPDYARYLQTLSSIRTVQAKVTLGGESAADRTQLDQLRTQLSQLENTIGLDTKIVPKRREKIGFQNSLRDIQTRLGSTDALLSFSAGKDRSFLWAVTREQVHLYELPREQEIAERVKSFEACVRQNRDVQSASAALSRTLLSSIEDSVWSKRDWLITGDGPLSQALPFPLLKDLKSAKPDEIVGSTHTLRLVPSELLLLNSGPKPQNARFLGIGDPIYNAADSRQSKDVRYVSVTGKAKSTSLARLVGSDREIRAAASLSAGSGGKLLIGKDANFSALASALAESPAVIHFAVHVVSPDGKPEQAALALSTDKDGIPELLTSEAIAAFRVPGSLVVLSGCSSGQGRAVPGAGLIGLSRAWLLAGASAVIVSSWPTPDDSGQFFSAFYNHLRDAKTGSLAQRASLALEQAQTDMRNGGGYRSLPSFWAAYSIVTKE